MTEKAPKDVVPAAPVDWAALNGKTVRIEIPGEVITDPDGVPIGVGPTKVFEETLIVPRDLF